LKFHLNSNLLSVKEKKKLIRACFYKEINCQEAEKQKKNFSALLFFVFPKFIVQQKIIKSYQNINIQKTNLKYKNQIILLTSLEFNNQSVFNSLSNLFS